MSVLSNIVTLLYCKLLKDSTSEIFSKYKIWEFKCHLPLMADGFVLISITKSVQNYEVGIVELPERH